MPDKEKHPVGGAQEKRSPLTWLFKSKEKTPPERRRIENAPPEDIPFAWANPPDIKPGDPADAVLKKARKG